MSGSKTRGVWRSARRLLWAIALSAPAAGAGAQSSVEIAPATPALPRELLHVSTGGVSIPPGGEAVLRVTARVTPGWHVNANPPSEDYLIPTEARLELPAGLAAGAARYPEGRSLRFAFSEEPLSVYEGEFAIEIPLRAEAAIASGLRRVAGSVRYQACNDELCLAPASAAFEAAIEVGGAVASPPGGVGATAETRPRPAGDGRAFTSADEAGNRARSGRGASRIESLGRQFAENPLLAFLVVFGMGLALNLTPCVYPMLSVTLALFGARNEPSLAKRLVAAVVYVLGIAAMYSVLGLVAALTGTLFGSLLQNSWVLIGIAVLLGAMSLSMFGLYELQAPSSLLQSLGGQSTAGLVGIFGSGLVVGIFAAPCIGPPIVALLAVVAQSGNAWFGFWAFFVLALGLGAPYLALATSTGLLQKLPRSGEWMVWVKKLFGVLLLGVALFYLLLAVRDEWAVWVIPVTLVLGGLYLGFLESTGNARRGFAVVKRGIGVVAVAGGLLLALSLPRRGIAWEPYTPQALGLAAAERQPVILEFSASWCIPCKELEHVTFADPDVIRLTSRFRTLQVDLSDFDSPASAAVRERFDVDGVPTIVFLDPEGEEVPGTRVVGFVSAEEFASLAQRALAQGFLGSP